MSLVGLTGLPLATGKMIRLIASLGLPRPRLRRLLDCVLRPGLPGQRRIGEVQFGAFQFPTSGKPNLYLLVALHHKRRGKHNLAFPDLGHLRASKENFDIDRLRHAFNGGQKHFHRPIGVDRRLHGTLSAKHERRRAFRPHSRTGRQFGPRLHRLLGLLLLVAGGIYRFCYRLGLLILSAINRFSDRLLVGLLLLTRLVLFGLLIGQLAALAGLNQLRLPFILGLVSTLVRLLPGLLVLTRLLLVRLILSGLLISLLTGLLFTGPLGRLVSCLLITLGLARFLLSSLSIVAGLELSRFGLLLDRLIMLLILAGLLIGLLISQSRLPGLILPGLRLVNHSGHALGFACPDRYSQKDKNKRKNDCS